MLRFFGGLSRTGQKHPPEVTMVATDDKQVFLLRDPGLPLVPSLFVSE